MRMGKQRKLSPSERNFAWQHKKTAVCETVIKLVYHIVFWGPGGAQLQNPNIKVYLMILKVPKPSVLGKKHFCTGWEFTLLPSFIMKVRSEWMRTTMFVCLLESFCSIFCTKYEKIALHASIKISILLNVHFLWVGI